MPRLFISYRRDDSPSAVHLIYERLIREFPPESVFRDIDHIGLGDNFVAVLQENVASCEVMLVVIGKNWFNATKEGQKRLFDEKDYVRIEVKTALDLHKIVIPLLVDGAAMPKNDELPDVLHPLTQQNGLAVRAGRDFESDMAFLIEAIEKKTGAHSPDNATPARTQQKQRSRPEGCTVYGIITLAISLAALIFAYLALPTEQRIDISRFFEGLFTQSSALTHAERSSLIKEQAVRRSLQNTISAPRGLVVAPSVGGMAVWGYGDADGRLFALNAGTGDLINIWTEDDAPRDYYPLRPQLGDAFRPSTLYYDGVWLWIGDSRDNRIVALDPITLEQRAEYAFGDSGDPVAMVNVENMLWITLQDTSQVAALDIDHETQTIASHCASERLEVGSNPKHLALQGKAIVWVSSDDGLAKIAVQSCRIESAFNDSEAVFASAATSLAIESNTLWLTIEGELWRVDLTTTRPPEKITIRDADVIEQVITSNASIWLLTNDQRTLLYDPVNQETLVMLTQTTPIGAVFSYGAQFLIATDDNVITRYAVPTYVHLGVIDIASHSGKLWLIDGERQLCQVTPEISCKSLDNGETASALAASSSSMQFWLATHEGTLWKVNASDGKSEKITPVGGEIRSMTEETGKYLWFTDGLTLLGVYDLIDNRLIDLTQSTVNLNVRIPQAITYDGTTVWFGYDLAQQLTPIRFDGSTLRVDGASIPIMSGKMVDITADDRLLYIASTLVTSVNPHNGQTGASFGIGDGLSALAASEDKIWAVIDQNGFIFELDNVR